MPLTNIVFVGQGAIAECSDVNRQAWNAAFRASGLRWDWTWDTFVELMRPGGSRRMVERYADFIGVTVDAEKLKQAHRRALCARMADELPLRSGVGTVLSWAARNGLGLGLVSRADAVHLGALLAATARARGGVEFDVVLSGDAVARPVPYPDGIRDALEQLGGVPEHALAIADTPASAAAALDAGLETLAFPGLLAEEATFPEGVHYVTRLSPEFLAGFSGVPAQAAE